MSYTEHPERERILNQALRARTYLEIATATREMDQWVDDHPDDLGIIDAYEVLENMQEIAEFQQEELNRQPLAKIAA
jgi:aminoglycoside phosphotransferase family enzyme